MSTLTIDEAIQNQNVKDLLKLIKKNPTLPIVAMVDGEIVGGDDYGRWVGSFGGCRVDEYVYDEYYGDGCIMFKGDDDERLIEGIAEYKYNGTEEDYQRAKEELETMWVKAIIVYIDLPIE